MKPPLVRSLLYSPHPGQLAFHLSPARFRILCCGRRWGKTKAAVAEAFRLAIASGSRLAACDLRDAVPLSRSVGEGPALSVVEGPGVRAAQAASLKPQAPRGWVVAPTYALSMEAWREFLSLAPADVIASINKTEHRIALTNDAIIECRSADNETSLRGAGLNFLIVDEAARVKDESWHALRPCLSDTLGKAILISTPKGHNWFYHLFLRGQDPLQADYQSWQFPSSDNPYFPRDETQTAQSELFAPVFQQEYLAQFIDDASSVFRNVIACARGDFQEPTPGHSYFLGVDLARQIDFTVLSVLDANTRSLVAFERFHQIDWSIQKARIVSLARKYNALTLLDSSGLGDPILEDLRNLGLHVEGVTLTPESKRQLINHLAILLEEQTISFPPIPQLISELQAYTYDLLPSGSLRFQAPSGLHDDSVISLSLACFPLSMPTAIITTRSGRFRTP